jgi:hypothetical protein
MRMPHQLNVVGPAAKAPPGTQVMMSLSPSARTTAST